MFAQREVDPPGTEFVCDCCGASCLALRTDAPADGLCSFCRRDPFWMFKTGVRCCQSAPKRRPVR